MEYLFKFFMATLAVSPRAGQPVFIHVWESTLLLCPSHADTTICCPSKFCPAQQGSSSTHTTPRVLLVVRRPSGITPNDQRLMHTRCDLHWVVHQQKVPLTPSASPSFFFFLFLLVCTEAWLTHGKGVCLSFRLFLSTPFGPLPSLDWEHRSSSSQLPTMPACVCLCVCFRRHL